MCIRDSFATTSILEVLKAMEHQKDLAFDPYFVVQLPHNTADFSKAALFVYVRIDDSELLRDLQSHFAKLADVTIDNACAHVALLRLKLERSADNWEAAITAANDHESSELFNQRLPHDMTEFAKNPPSFRSPGYGLLNDFAGTFHTVPTFAGYGLLALDTVREEILQEVERARSTTVKLGGIEVRFRRAKTLVEECHEHASTNGAFVDPAGRPCGKRSPELIMQKGQQQHRIVEASSTNTNTLADSEALTLDLRDPELINLVEEEERLKAQAQAAVQVANAQKVADDAAAQVAEAQKSAADAAVIVAAAHKSAKLTNQIGRPELQDP
eukprot:TRINITY_DN5345_c0_g1_i4.p1 TRINITY_DN5345_c0_g1~~TRINITY_DN5345_c0_g1_i4.p1  ORF type:complete len:328 (+),score=62.10 TRINITY_DN5345_c0_g1_i4:121-1104(+)